MRTVVLKCPPDDLEKAAQVLREGGLVAFPTETVYGLGANALDEKAVAKIFHAKGRPPDNPLIVHLASAEDLPQVVASIPPEAIVLASRFWPGPLTLVLPRKDEVPLITTGGLETVAVRVPDHPLALELIRRSGVPVAGPSANLSGRPSPTTAAHVLEDLGDKVDVIIDGGPTGLGVESTVLDLTTSPPVLLRPGGVTWEALEEVLGKVILDPAILAKEPIEEGPVRSPGMKYRHYAPKAKVYLVEGQDEERIAARVDSLAAELAAAGLKVGVLATAEGAARCGRGLVLIGGSRRDPAALAASLFAHLRTFDRLDVDAVVVEGIKPVGLGLAVMNRLRKAAGYNIIEA
ncbi:MAG: threonylcarbamoyl-AMP synthase [Firmicutes bacterium]|nr:threonylcarbamoyl-AMP synthase [Bacillota bacterium]